MEVYPKRPRFFSNRFMRLMAKACVAQEIGQDGFTLLSIIVGVEDAKGYRSAVTFFNEQLMPMAGFRSVDSLARSRKRVVDAGWLHYEKGSKSIAGKYWVTIPDRFSSMDDAPSDEAHDLIYYRTDAEIVNGSPPQNCGTIPEECAVSVRKNVRSECGTIPEECAEHSTLPLPLYLPQEGAPGQESEESWNLQLGEAGYRRLPFPDLFAQLCETHRDKSPPSRAELAWKIRATNESEAKRIVARCASWNKTDRWRANIGLPTLATFLRERWYDREPSKPDRAESRTEPIESADEMLKRSRIAAGVA